MECPHKIKALSPNFHPGGTAYRCELLEPADRCDLQPKRKDIEIYRWINSGGSAIDVAHECVKKTCPLIVIADIGNYYRSWVGPCPQCHISNKRCGPGSVACRDCGLIYELVESIL